MAAASSPDIILAYESFHRNVLLAGNLDPRGFPPEVGIRIIPEPTFEGPFAQTSELDSESEKSGMRVFTNGTQKTAMPAVG